MGVSKGQKENKIVILKIIHLTFKQLDFREVAPTVMCAEMTDDPYDNNLKQ